MKVSLIDMDYECRIKVIKKPIRNRFPNLALMKLSAWHKAQGDSVDWYPPFMSCPDRIYVSKVFTFYRDCVDFSANDPEPIKGGTGYGIFKNLPEEIDNMLPDYSIYPEVDYAVGFLSRGCIRHCPWCIVPKKEGFIRKYDDIERISQNRKHVILMDNNFLANDQQFIKEQLEKSKMLNLRIDFNQALDARLVTAENAKWLSEAKWIRYIRFACDTESVINDVLKAIQLVRSNGYNGEILCYFLAKDVESTMYRIRKFDGIKNFIPYVMPYRDVENNIDCTPILKKFARWCNNGFVRNSCTWDEYRFK